MVASVYTFARYTLNGLIRQGISIAHGVSTIPIAENSRYSGSVSSAIGIRKDPTTHAKTAPRPGKSNRARP